MTDEQLRKTGISLLLDLYECKSPALENESALGRLFEEALCFAGFETVNRLEHRFPGQGTTFIHILRQSHATLHTWPESGYVSVDVYSCGEPGQVRPALERIQERLAQSLLAGSVKAQLIERGT